MKITEKTPVLTEIQSLIPYELNSKKHNKEQVEKLALSIQKFGWRGNPILTDKHGVIIAGHGRRLAALSLGLVKVPVIVEDDMTAEEARAFRLADNRVSISDMDTNLFRQELETINIDDLRGIFDDKELEFSMSDLGEMSMDSFVEDLDVVVAEQQEELNVRLDEAKDKRHALVKAIGIKDVSCANARIIGQIISRVESEQSLSGEAALMHIFNSAIKE